MPGFIRIVNLFAFFVNSLQNKKTRHYGKSKAIHEDYMSFRKAIVKPWNVKGNKMMSFT